MLFQHASPKLLFVRSGVMACHQHSNCSEQEEDHYERDENFVCHLRIHDQPLPDEVAVEASQRQKREAEVHRHTQRVDLERGDKVSVEERGPGGRQATARAWTVEEQHAGARRQAELLVCAVPMFIRMEKHPNSGAKYPSRRPE